MALQDIIAQIDKEISDLQQAKSRLMGISEPSIPAKKGTRGRPKGSKNTSTKTAAVKVDGRKGKRNLSPEGRRRIAEAVKRRWAERRAAA